MSRASFPAPPKPALAPLESISATVHDFWGPDVRAVQAIEAVPRILKTVCMITGMGFATIARVTDDSWVCCASYDEIGFGMRPGTELDLQSTLCKDIRLTAQPVVIDEVAIDVTFADHPVPRMFRFQSNISFPIILKDGSIYGTLCAIDPKPARVSAPEIIATFRLFADLIASQLDLAQSLAVNKTAAADSRAPFDLRDQFIAVIGQNLHDPIRALAADVKQLAHHNLDGATPLVASLQNHIDTITRRADDVLDFARGRLGGGYGLHRDFDASLNRAIEQVLGEFRAASKDAIIARLDLQHPVNCDARRIGQMLSNFLNNALQYGTPGKPVLVEAITTEDAFTLSVANAGRPIAADVLARLFQPFQRAGAANSRARIVGLGLYIASEIARAHGGQIVADSNEQEIRFTFTMPLWINRQGGE